jgi:uncharacterized membrane protein (UPF0127 family)
MRVIWPRRAGAFEPQFQKEGSLQFERAADNRLLKRIDIELAQKEKEIQRGLMFRRSMEEDQGMLFLMPTEKPQSFWMLNTDLSLDIIFVNSDLEIVNIQANAEPRSLKKLPSQLPARYVVEVTAGFCAKYGIRERDRVQFSTSKKTPSYELKKESQPDYLSFSGKRTGNLPA